ncbi:MAG: NADH-quinone oxidoreductase subunit A [Anaerolineales bacterium]
MSTTDTTALWPLVVYFAAVLFVAAAMIGLAYILGERHKDRATDQIYESGILTTGDARLRLNAQFYMVAMFFVIFDLETVFIVAWALGVKELGWVGYIEILIFVGVLMAALVYLWRVGALDWGPKTQKSRRKISE